jgi:hypothetical protein
MFLDEPATLQTPGHPILKMPDLLVYRTESPPTPLKFEFKKILFFCCQWSDTRGRARHCGRALPGWHGSDRDTLFYITPYIEELHEMMN